MVHRPSGASGASTAMVTKAVAASLAVLLDNVMEMVLCRLLFASLLAVRCVCKRWRDLTVTPQFL